MPPIAPATRSRGNSSRMMPNASGKTAPPTPWITRATIMTPTSSSSAATSEPDDERREHDHEHALLAEHVAEAPEHGRRDRRAQQVRREDPRDGALRRVQVGLERRQRRHDHRLQKDVGHRADAEHGEGPVRALAGLLGVGAHGFTPGIEAAPSSTAAAAGARSPAGSGRGLTPPEQRRQAERAGRRDQDQLRQLVAPRELVHGNSGHEHYESSAAEQQAGALQARSAGAADAERPQQAERSAPARAAARACSRRAGTGAGTRPACGSPRDARRGLRAP